ncbi:MAG: hypothetical protein AAB883_00135 [Patescibacteria group bacterium]
MGLSALFAFVVTAGATATRSIRSATLRDHLTALGIPILPKREVGRHKREYMRAQWPERFVFLMVVMKALSALLTFTSLLFIPRLVKSVAWAFFVAWSLYLTSVMMLANSTPHVSGIDPTLLKMLEVVPLLSLIALGCISVAMMVICAPRTALPTWKRISFSEKGGLPYGTPTLPKHLLERAQIVEHIPGTRLKIEYLDIDPFLVIERGTGLGTEREYIGGWATGNPRFDNT